MSAWSPQQDIELLLHFAAKPGEMPPGIADPAQAQPITDALARLARDGIVVLVDMKWHLAERGRVWLDMICATPMPVSQWIDPRGLTVMAVDPAGRDEGARATIRVAPSGKTELVSVERIDNDGVAHRVRHGTIEGGVDGSGGVFVGHRMASDGPVIPEGFTPWQGETTALPKDVPGNQYLTIIRRNGEQKQLFAASVNWKTRNRPEDVVGFAFTEEPEAFRRAAAAPGLGRKS